MNEKPRKQRSDEDVDQELDQALEDSFPGSDPISLTSPTRSGKPKPDDVRDNDRALPRKNDH